jgi:hypothetical protein
MVSLTSSPSYEIPAVGNVVRDQGNGPSRAYSSKERGAVSRPSSNPSADARLGGRQAGLLGRPVRTPCGTATTPCSKGQPKMPPEEIRLIEIYERNAQLERASVHARACRTAEPATRCPWRIRHRKDDVRHVDAARSAERDSRQGAQSRRERGRYHIFLYSRGRRRKRRASQLAITDCLVCLLAMPWPLLSCASHCIRRARASCGFRP